MSKVSTLEHKPGASGLKKYEATAPTQEQAIEYFEGKKSKWEKRCTEIPGAKFDDLIPNIAFAAKLPTGYAIYYELEL